MNIERIDGRRIERLHYEDTFCDVWFKLSIDKHLESDEIRFLKELGSKVGSISLCVDGSRKMMDMDYNDWAVLIAIAVIININKLDTDSLYHVFDDRAFMYLLQYPKELIELIDHVFWVFEDDVDIDIENLIDICVEKGYNETTMVLLRYLHEKRGEAEPTTMRL